MSNTIILPDGTEAEVSTTSGTEYTLKNSSGDTIYIGPNVSNTTTNIIEAIEQINTDYSGDFIIDQCDACGEKDAPLGKHYNWGNNPDTERSICKKCVCKALDKQFGISPKRIKTEETLYGNKK